MCVITFSICRKIIAQQTEKRYKLNFNNSNQHDDGPPLAYRNRIYSTYNKYRMVLKPTVESDEFFKQTLRLN